MKKFIKNSTVLILVTFLHPLIAESQNDTISNKFEFHSISASPTGIYAGNTFGLAVSGDVSFNYGVNIFSLAVGTGSELVVLGYSEFYQQANLLYGREYRLSKRTLIDVSAGAGYFHNSTYGSLNDNTSAFGEIDRYTIGFPVSTKIRFMLSSRFSMGLQLQLNINSAQTIFTTGIILQWDRKRKW